MNLKGFDLSKGMIVDFMHACLLGVTELHTEILFTSTGEKFYVGSRAAVRVIDQRLLSMKPPTCIANVPKSIEERKNSKASHWLIWLLFGSIPCLQGLLPAKYLNHLALFVTAINILLQDSITPKELKTARKLLVKYVYGFNVLFGNQYMHYNVHLLLHLCDTVENWGPLWAINTFPFENENKNLLQMKKCNYHFAKQIAIRLLTYQQIPQLESECFISQQTKDFCDKLNSNRLKKAFQIEDCTLIGNGKRHTLTEKQLMCLRLNNINCDKITECKKYYNMVYQSCRYTSCFYSRKRKTNDSVFETKNNQFGIITSIYLIKHDNKHDVYVFYKPLTLQTALNLTDDDLKDMINLKKCFIPTDDVMCIKYSTLHRPCFIFKCNNNYCISSLVKGVIGRCIN